MSLVLMRCLAKWTSEILNECEVSHSRSVRGQVREIIAYYNQQREGLGVEFASELKQTLMRIRHYRKLGRHFRHGFDGAVLTDLPIVLFTRCGRIFYSLQRYNITVKSQIVGATEYEL